MATGDMKRLVEETVEEFIMASSSSSETEASVNPQEGLVHVSTPFLFVSVTPLLFLAYVSWSMGLELESPIVVGALRTSVQLTVLGLILNPIFTWGIELWWLVLLYVLFMLVLASLESSARSKYYFEGMFSCVLGAFVANAGLVSVFAFGLVIRPRPLWNPQYVIPIVGMLLGNCINGVALAMNAVLTSLVEQSQEVELLLSFGASANEASARLMRESVRVGAMPMLNSMAVIGLISIPGMMTGQILGGSPVMEAARYQMLICYLIAICAFGTILTEVWISRGVAFDASSQMLRTDRFIKRTERISFLGRIAAIGRFLTTRFFGSTTSKEPTGRGETEPLSNAIATPSSTYVAPKGSLEMITLRHGMDGSHQRPTANLEICRMSRSILVNGQRRTLFRDLSVSIQAGDIVVVSGPSGVGKTQLFRLVAGLSPMDDDGDADLLLLGKSRSAFTNPANWRCQVRYVSQYKVDIPGTPRQFMERVSSFQSWRQQDAPSFEDMTATSLHLIQTWGLETNCLDTEWKILSGGEAQRMYLAIALASRPRVLLMDESTSALDLDSKMRVEQSVRMAVSQDGMSVLWITHDQDQVERIGGTTTA